MSRHFPSGAAPGTILPNRECKVEGTGPSPWTAPTERDPGCGLRSSGKYPLLCQGSAPSLGYNARRHSGSRPVAPSRGHPVTEDWRMVDVMPSACSPASKAAHRVRVDLTRSVSPFIKYLYLYPWRENCLDSDEMGLPTRRRNVKVGSDRAFSRNFAKYPKPPYGHQVY